jgi:hypothetical protein
MPKQTTDILKSWFQTGDKPTQSQFADLIDSFVHKDAGISIENVAGLIDVLNLKASSVALDALRALVQPVKVELTADGTYTLPAGFQIWKMTITPQQETGLVIEELEGAGDILDLSGSDYPYPGGTDNNFTCDIIARADKVIRFRNVNGPITILIYRLSLTPIN